jgi:hypothetical protein
VLEAAERDVRRADGCSVRLEALPRLRRALEERAPNIEVVLWSIISFTSREERNSFTNGSGPTRGRDRWRGTPTP